MMIGQVADIWVLIREREELRREVARLVAINKRLTARNAELQRRLYEQSKGQKVAK